MAYFLNRNSSLKSRTIIKTIFEKKQGFIQYPIRVSYLLHEINKPTQIVFSAPKRNFKKAVDRNKIKRMMREAYRLNQSIVLDQLGEEQKSLAIYLGYVGKEIVDYSVIEEKIKVSLIRLLKEIEN